MINPTMRQHGRARRSARIWHQLAGVAALFLGALVSGCQTRPAQPIGDLSRLTAPPRGTAFDYVLPSCWSYDSQVLFYTREHVSAGSQVRALWLGGREIAVGIGHSPAAAKVTPRLAYFSGDRGLRLWALARFGERNGVQLPALLSSVLLALVERPQEPVRMPLRRYDQHERAEGP